MGDFEPSAKRGSLVVMVETPCLGRRVDLEIDLRRHFVGAWCTWEQIAAERLSYIAPVELVENIINIKAQSCRNAIGCQGITRSGIEHMIARHAHFIVWAEGLATRILP